MVSSSAHTRTIRLSLAICLTGLLLVLGFLLMHGENPDRISSRGIPMPFGNRITPLRGQLSDIGSTTDNRPIVDMTFDDGEISETFGSGAVTFVVTPADPSSFSSGAPLSIALDPGKKFYGYKYTASDAAQEKAMQGLRDNPPLDEKNNPTAYTFKQLFPGTFFASDTELQNENFFPATFSTDQGVTFQPLSTITLEPDSRYLIIAEEDGVSLTVRGLALPPDITFTTVGSTPWSGHTFAIPRVSANATNDYGFFAYEGVDMLGLSDNTLTSRRVGSAPLGPVNYWWYPLVGPQSTVFGYPIIFNAYFIPCYSYATSMRQCNSWEVPMNGKISLPSPYAFTKASYIGEANWKPITSTNPSVTLIGDYPAVLSGSYAIRVRGKTIEACSGYSCGTMSTLPETGADIARHEGALYVMTADGKHMYTSMNARQWKRLTIAGIDFPVRQQTLLSKDGHLWIVGRGDNDAKDRILAWPPVTQKENAYYLSMVSQDTVNLDSGCSNNNDRAWHLPSQNEFLKLLPALNVLYGSLPKQFFRIEASSGLSFPVMSLGGVGPQESSNSDNLFCISPVLGSDEEVAGDPSGCTVLRQPTASSGGEIRFKPTGAELAVRIEDSCSTKIWDRINSLDRSCAGKGCFLRSVSCVDSLPVETVTECPSSCRDGVCNDPLDNGVKTLTDACPIRISGHPYQTTVADQKLFVSNAGANSLSIVDLSDGSYKATQIDTGWAPSPLLYAPTPSMAPRGFISDQNGIEVIDLGQNVIAQTLKLYESPMALVGTKLYIVQQGIYNTIDVNNEIGTTLSAVPVSITNAVTNPVALVATGSTLISVGTITSNSTIPGAVSLIDTLQNTVTSMKTLTGKPTRISLIKSTAYILTQNADTVTVLDTVTGTVTATIALPGTPSDMTFDGTTMYVVTSSGTTGTALVDIDTVSNTITNTMKLPQGLTEIAVSHGKGYLMSPNDYLYVIDLASHDAVSMLKLPDSPHHLQKINDDLFVLMQNYAAAAAGDPLRGQIFVIDTATDTAKDTCGN